MKWLLPPSEKWNFSCWAWCTFTVVRAAVRVSSWYPIREYTVCKFNNQRFIIWHNKSGGWAISSLTDSLTELHCLLPSIFLFFPQHRKCYLHSWLQGCYSSYKNHDFSANKKGFFPCVYQGSSFPRNPPAVFLLVSINQVWVTCPFLSQSYEGKEIGYFYFWFGLIHTQSRSAKRAHHLNKEFLLMRKKRQKAVRFSQRLPLKLLFNEIIYCFRLVII